MDKDDAAQAANEEANSGAQGGSTSDAGGGDEARARRMGWRPPEEFDEDMVAKPRKMLSASEYIEKVEGDLPILRERNRFLDQTVGKLQKSLGDATTEIKSTREKLNDLGGLVEDLHKQNVEVGKRAYDRARRDLEAELDAATLASDPAAVRTITKEIVELEKQAPKQREERREAPERTEKPARTETKPAEQPGTQAAQISKAAKDWIDANQKIMKDPVLNPVAVNLHTENLRSGMTEEESFEKLFDQLRTELPHKFDNPRRAAPAAVAGTAAGGDRRSGKKKGFEALPDDAKRTYQKLSSHWASKGKSYNKDDYAREYWLNLEASE